MSRARWYRGFLITPGRNVKNNILGYAWAVFMRKDAAHLIRPMVLANTVSDCKRLIDEHLGPNEKEGIRVKQ